MKGFIALMLVGLAVLFLYARTQRIQAGEADARGGLQAINAAEQAYIFHFPELGYTCNLLALGPQMHGRPSAAAADLLDPELARGMKNGYRFIVDRCHTNAQGRTVAYHIRAEPRLRGWDGKQAFCTDETGLVRLCDEERSAGDQRGAPERASAESVARLTPRTPQLTCGEIQMGGSRHIVTAK